MKRSLTVNLLAIVAGLLHVQSAGAQATSLRAEVDALHTDMVESFRKDPALVARFYTDDASILGGGGRYVGRDQVNQYWTQIPPGAEWKLEVIEVGGDSQSPWMRGRSILRSPSGRSMETEYIGILKRQPDGKLRFYVDMYVSASSVRRVPSAPGVQE